MHLKIQQLENSLKKEMAPVFLISGDEPLQIGEATDSIRKVAKKLGYQSREVFSVEKDFEWNKLAIAANSLSIFADKKLLELRMSSAKPGTEGTKALSGFCHRLPADTLLLITTPKIDKATLKTKWIESINQVGVIVQIWPLEGADLIQWLQQRSKSKGLHIDLEGIKTLASRVEGNLLAAAQEIEKLYILYGNTPLSRQEVEEAVADSTRFDVFKLTDCILSGRISRAIKILNGLKVEGVAEPIVLWALTREARMLVTIKTAINQGKNKETVFKNYRLWNKRKQLVNLALCRLEMNNLEQIILLCAKADRQIKGQENGNSWETFVTICLVFSSQN